MATKTPKVSVIIPAYNQALYLGQAIQSVLMQSFQDYEIVVVNDGSTDETAAVAIQFGDKIRYIYQDNQGLAGARNAGISEALGDLIALLDSDDLWLPEYLERMVTLAKMNPWAVVFYCAARCIDVNGSPLKQIVGYHPVEPGNLYHYLLRSNFIIPSTVMLRKAVLHSMGDFNQTLRSCEDWDLWLNLLCAGYDFSGSPEVLVYYRIHDNSLSANVKKMQFSYRSVVEKHFGDDDQQYVKWNEEKRIAFGGFYRYQLLTNIQRRNDWQGVDILRKVFQTDPVSFSDLDFYYELALGSQPIGYRGTTYQLNLEKNAINIEILLADLFSLLEDSMIQSRRNVIYGTAYKAIGLVAYNTGQFPLSRKYFRLAIQQQPFLLQEKRVIGCFLKSYLGKSGLKILRNVSAHKIQDSKT